jgi:glyoxylase-like metal-dependent hydrolase (beta-lactamase superfamily II)
MIEEIGKHIKAIFTEDGFTASNCLLVEDDVKLMIDSGAGTILSEVNTSAIDILLNSHRHMDHVRGNNRMRRARILTHPLERIAMQDPLKIAALSGWEEFMKENIFEEARQLGMSSEKLLKPWRIDGEINDGQIIDCGKARIEVLLTPGHTSGHCSFLFPEEGLVFMADICLTEVGPWYGEEQADIDDFVASINKIIALKPKRIMTGHRQEIIDQDIPAKLGEYRDRIFRREERILNLIRGNPLTINQIAAEKIIYPEHPIIFVLFWERRMVKKHLDHLIKRGLVEKLEDGRYGAKKTAATM